MKPDKARIYWRLCCTAAILLVALSFTPLVIRPGVFTPKLFGIPYTLWAGILIAIGLVVLTFIAVRVHPGKSKEKEL